MAIGELEEFAASLVAVAEKGAWPDLRTFAVTLRQQAEDFDLDRLPQTLRRFGEVFQKLTQLPEPPQSTTSGKAGGLES